MAVAVLLLAFEALIGAVAFRASGLLLDIATPMLATLTTFIVMLAATLEQAEQQRRSLRDAATRVAGELPRRAHESGLLAEPAIQFATNAPSTSTPISSRRRRSAATFSSASLDQRRLLFAVGDVSGKGMAAALFMALDQGVLQATALRADGDVSGIVGRAASEIALENRNSMFVTCSSAYSTWSPARSNTATRVTNRRSSAGRGVRWSVSRSPRVRRCAWSTTLRQTRYRDLAPGEWICVLSDGVTESTNAQGELFGAARVEAALARRSTPRARPTCWRRCAPAFAFVGDAPAVDDLTLLVLRWVGPISAIPVEDEEADLADVDLDAPVARLGDVVGGRSTGSRSPRPAAWMRSAARPWATSALRTRSARASESLSSTPARRRCRCGR